MNSRRPPYVYRYGKKDLYDIGLRLLRGDITKKEAQAQILIQFVTYKGKKLIDNMPYHGYSESQLEEDFGIRQSTDFTWDYLVSEDELCSEPSSSAEEDIISEQNWFKSLVEDEDILIIFSPSFPMDSI